MTAKKAYFIILTILILAIIGIGGSMYAGTMVVKKTSDKLIQTKLDNIGLDTQEQQFLQSRKVLDKYKTLNQTISKILPKNKDQALAVKELYQIGDETGIVVSKIQFPTSTLAKSKATSTQSSTKTVTQAKQVAGMTGVLGIDISISLQPANGKSISYDNMLKFLQKVELNRRNMQIKNITVNADTINGGVTFELTLTIFVKP